MVLLIVGDSCGGGDGGHSSGLETEAMDYYMRLVGWLGVGLLMGMTEKKWSQIEKRNLFI